MGLTVFQKKSDNFHWTSNTDTHFTDENQRKIREGQPVKLFVVACVLASGAPDCLWLVIVESILGCLW